MVKKLENYFAGRDIREYYEKMRTEHPGKIKMFDFDERNFIFFGKVLPDVIDLASIILGLSGHLFIGAFSLGAGEALRKSVKDDFEFKKGNYEWDIQYEKIDYNLRQVKENIDAVEKYMKEHPDAKIELRIREN